MLGKVRKHNAKRTYEGHERVVIVSIRMICIGRMRVNLAAEDLSSLMKMLIDLKQCAPLNDDQ
jgi:hypothetical protein